MVVCDFVALLHMFALCRLRHCSLNVVHLHFPERMSAVRKIYSMQVCQALVSSVCWGRLHRTESVFSLSNIKVTVWISSTLTFTISYLLLTLSLSRLQRIYYVIWSGKKVTSQIHDRFWFLLQQLLNKLIFLCHTYTSVTPLQNKRREIWMACSSSVFKKQTMGLLHTMCAYIHQRPI